MSIIDDANNLELFREELAFLINKAHNVGINYWLLLGEVLKMAAELYLMASAEYRVKGG